MVAALGLALTLLVATPASAATRTVVLSVPGMTCPSCPVTLRKALDRVPGVRVVSADLNKRTLEVKVTDSQVTDQEITSTTTNVGFPSTVVKDAHK